MKPILVFLLFCTALAIADTTKQKSNTQENLRGVSAVDERIAWASGTHGTYLRTTDGGITWQVGHVSGAEAIDFRDVEAFSGDEAYLLAAGPGDQSRIYKTLDGGKSWTLQFTNKEPKGFFDCMAFWDRYHGIAVGDPVDGKFQLIKTENGGKEWKPIPPANLPPAIEGEGAFAASGTCITTQGKNNAWFVTGGSAARVFRSQNAGESWSVAETPIVHGPASAGIFSIAFRDAKHGMIVGGDYKDPGKRSQSVATTGDGGKSWRLSPLSGTFLSAVAFVSSMKNRVVATGSLGQFGTAKNPQAGKWEVFDTIPLAGITAFNREHAELNALAVQPSAYQIWVVGAKGVIFLIDDVCRSCSKK